MRIVVDQSDYVFEMTADRAAIQRTAAGPLPPLQFTRDSNPAVAFSTLLSMDYHLTGPGGQKVMEVLLCHMIGKHLEKFEDDLMLVRMDRRGNGRTFRVLSRSDRDFAKVVAEMNDRQEREIL